MLPIAGVPDPAPPNNSEESNPSVAFKGYKVYNLFTNVFGEKQMERNRLTDLRTFFDRSDVITGDRLARREKWMAVQAGG